MNRPRGLALAVALGLAAIVTAAILTAAPAVASAADVSSAQLRQLATGAAGGNAAALAKLRAVTAVDGQPAQVAQALAGATPAEVRGRALALARSAPPTTTTRAAAPGPARARALATSILAESRYGKATVANPLDSALESVGRWLASLADESPGGPVGFWAAAAALVLVLAAFSARRALRRLDPARAPAGRQAKLAAEDPAALQRAARAAEEAGAYDEAVRLRYRAGLLLLGSHAAIDYRPSLLAADVARRLDSPRFDELNDTFARVAYGGAPADSEDADDAREGWREVLAEAGGRR